MYTGGEPKQYDRKHSAQRYFSVLVWKLGTFAVLFPLQGLLCDL